MAMLEFGLILVVQKSRPALHQSCGGVSAKLSHSSIFHNNTVDSSKSQIHTKILTIDITECSRSKSFMIHLNL